MQSTYPTRALWTSCHHTSVEFSHCCLTTEIGSHHSMDVRSSHQLIADTIHRRMTRYTGYQEEWITLDQLGVSVPTNGSLWIELLKPLGWNTLRLGKMYLFTRYPVHVAPEAWILLQTDILQTVSAPDGPWCQRTFSIFVNYVGLLQQLYTVVAGNLTFDDKHCRVIFCIP